MHKITSIEKYKGSTYAVELDEEKTIYLHASIVADFGLYADMELSGERLREIRTASYERRAYERALFLLDYRDHSYYELVQKLKKNYPEQICYDTADRLAKNGLLDDRRYAESLARRYVEIKKWGRYRAKNEMRVRGLDKALIEEALERYEDSYCERISELIEQKYERYLIDKKGILKVKNALVRLGYSYDEVNHAISEFTDDAED